ncbi:cytochrome o ubiquinol oxidase subunit 2 [Phyllobacterium sp. 1468]|uniref:ubiquinol oxidase subunit II n=1 Tax=Phyllobacterium sp. 1468 TaxID=2817759 RepID=UPI001AE7B5A2|nr:ubiquinol oxidase subunit II [Phyllobacterium sp. 1468]MDR6634414.1 cytochrome o ubiquinol oxidase subunit 2 [Phyllobacterium sp. 1468]
MSDVAGSYWRSGVLDPQGPVGAAQNTILLNATTIMLAVIIPVIVLTLGFAWWFRHSNARANYMPDWSYSGRIELIVWSIPAMVVLFLGGIAWIGSHDLDPRKQIDSGTVAPLDVQVVSLDWKWLFIYPDLGVASVNSLTVPAGVPIRFQLTSATVMNSFFVPQLGSQIYTMEGMTTRLNLLADKPGRYPGLSAQFSGEGFSDMRFMVDAMPQQDFDQWTANTRAAGGSLDKASYAQLARPSSAVASATFGQVEENLFNDIVNSNNPASGTSPTGHHSAPSISDGT